MSMCIIHCNQCKGGRTLDCILKFNYQTKVCDSCHHLDVNEWSYYFCNIACMFKWLRENQIEELGFPCQRCRATGFAYGFEVNGVCSICQRSKRVKARLKESWDQDVDQILEGGCDVSPGEGSQSPRPHLQ